MAEETNQIDLEFEKFIAQIVDSKMKDFLPTPLESREQRKRRLKTEYERSFKEFQELLVKAGDALGEAGFEPENLVEADLNAFKDNFEEQIQISIKEGKSMAEVIGFTGTDLKNMYSIGCEYHAQKKEETARDIFLFLTMLNNQLFPFWSALGMVEEDLNHYDSAAMAHAFAAELDDQNPVHYLYIANCLRHQNRMGEALQLVDLILEGIEGDQTMAALKTQAAELKKEWEKVA